MARKRNTLDTRKKTRPASQTSRRRVAKKAAFLAEYRKTGNISSSAEAAQVERGTIYDWERADPEFAAGMATALDTYVDKMEKEADRRAVDGVEEPIYQDGRLVGTKQRYSDTLLMFRLNGLRPEKYVRRQKTELTGAGGGPIETVAKAEDLSALTLDELRELRRLRAKLDAAKNTGAAK